MTSEALTAGRAMAEARMESRATVRRATGPTTQNETTGLEGSSWTDVYTDLPLRIKSGGASEISTADGVRLRLQNAEAHFPTFGTEDLRDNDLVVVTLGEWDGTVWKIIESRKGDQETARRIPVIETSPPAEWSS